MTIFWILTMKALYREGVVKRNIDDIIIFVGAVISFIIDLGLIVWFFLA